VGEFGWPSGATAKLHNAALHSVSTSQSQAPFVAVTASRPAGECNRRYAKLPTLERSPVVSAPRSLRALRAAARRPSGVLALWHWSGAARRVLVSGFAVHLVFAPAHPWACLLRSIARAVCPSAPRGGSLRTALLFGFVARLGVSDREDSGYRPCGLQASVTAGLLLLSCLLCY